MISRSLAPVPLARVGAIAIAFSCLEPAFADGAGDFSSSFEKSEATQPFQNRVETGNGQPMQRNVTARASNALLEQVAKVTASGDNPPTESAARAGDDDTGSKWLTRRSTGWVEYELKKPGVAVAYTMTSGNDAPDRDPRDWKVLASNDGQNWTTIDAQSGQSWGEKERRVTKSYPISSPRAWKFYKLDVTANHGGGYLQVAEFGLTPPPSPGGVKITPITTAVSSGPSAGYNIKPLAGWTGLQALKYAGQHTADGRGFAMNRLFDVNIPVGKDTRLSYLIFPALTANDLQYPSTYVAVNLHFTDGTNLYDLAPLDAYEYPATAAGQGASKILYPNQWNMVRVDVGAVAAGKTIDAIELCYDNPGATAKTEFNGWIDDIKIEANPRRIDGSSLTHYVDTRRGTNSSGSFSRGSNEAITAIPNGFNFLVPVTDATAMSREYSYQADNDENNMPHFEGLSVCHEPSPWMGDRNVFSMMPVPGDGVPSGNPHTRSATFSHDNEIAQPDYYAVDLDNGAKAEMTPTNRGMVMRFTFPGNSGSVVLDSPTGDGEFHIDSQTGEVTGWIDKGAGFIAGQSRMFVSGKFDEKPVGTGTAPDGRPLTKYAKFSTGGKKPVTLRLATSLISLDQAQKNLEMEIGDKTFDAVRTEANRIWNDRLGVIRVEGATETELVTLYSCLYRLNLYPNAQFENVGTPENPKYEYASPVSRPVGESTATNTGAKIVPGRMYVNNGFWDTYRTVWPAYSLLYPKVAAELVDGFIDQYRDGGWVARWSSPGYANIMTGTSSDAAFADAYLRGVKLPDPLATYDAAFKNATAPSRNDKVGRKALTTSIFLGYTPQSQHESVSWATEGFINDFGIGNMAAALAEDPATPDGRRQELREQSEYLLDRATNYVNLFDPAIGFFQARGADGKFEIPPDQYDPKEWWGPYTETNGWNFAFHAPQDPQGLANLYGGRAGLEKKLDEFFSTPETSPGPIHEEVEARDARFGQWGVSNQVSHHIPFIYNGAGVPAKAQKIAREAVQRSFTGSEIGQGYAGDEDNGEMSAWYVFNALGLYPLQVGSNQLVIGSPLFDKVTVNLEDGKTLVISAPGNTPANVYVQSVTFDGRPVTSTTINSDIFRTGGTLDVKLGSHPSKWGTGPNDAPPSLTKGSAVALPLADVTGSATPQTPGGEDVSALFDNSSETNVKFSSSTPSVTISFNSRQNPVFYTLTASEDSNDPASWILEGSDTGANWTKIDERKDEVFPNRRQTLPFKIQKPGAYQKFRLTITGGSPQVSLSEIELLARPAGK